MAAPKKNNERPRELRRRVLMPARIRSGQQWSDACILNISSRGLMIQAHRAGAKGSIVELYRDGHVITARIVWRDGSRAGLQADERLPVEEIMSVGSASSLRLVASNGALIERRRLPRSTQTDARSRGRALEFAGTVAIVVFLAFGAAAMAEQALLAPLSKIGAALNDG